MSVLMAGSRLVHYEAAGRGQPVILLHGWLGSWRYWWPTMQALATHARAFAFDLYGFGGSSKSADAYSLESYVEQLDDFVAELGLSLPLSLVGHALGAAVALHFAGRQPRAVARLALVGLPSHGRHFDPRSANGRSLAHSDRYQSVSVELHKNDAAAVSKLAGQLAGHSFAADFDQLACPTLLIYGRDDPAGRWPLAAADGPCQRVELPGCGQFPMLEQPAVFNRLLQEFIRTDLSSPLAPKVYWQRRTR
ncbi:MAG: alpha/beta fold hydrolase [Candidatus Promineifilaceae bacterium]